MRRASLLVLAVVLLAMSGPEKRLEILRHTSVAWEDEEVLIVVRAQPHPDNRALVIAASDDGVIVRQSVIQLDGEEARATYWIRWRLPAGELMIRAVLCQAKCERPVASVTVPLTVLSRL